MRGHRCWPPHVPTSSILSHAMVDDNLQLVSCLPRRHSPLGVLIVADQLPTATCDSRHGVSAQDLNTVTTPVCGVAVRASKRRDPERSDQLPAIGLIAPGSPTP